jgi:hypothetical protein
MAQREVLQLVALTASNLPEAKQIGPVLTNALPFAGSRCERVPAAVLLRPVCLRELGNLSAHRSSNGRQHVNQVSLRH